MARVKRGVTARRRHKKVLKQAKGYYNFRRSIFRVAKQAVTKACVPCIVDHPYQRAGTGECHHLQPTDCGSEKSQHRN